VPHAKLWVLGDGYERNELEKNAPDTVSFFGHVLDRKKIKLMKRAWVLVNPSVREGFGLNIIEANACGTPCIAFKVSGLKDTIKHGETGLLVDTNDIEGLAAAIKRIFREEAFRHELSENALRYSRQFNWDKTSRDMLEIIKMFTD